MLLYCISNSLTNKKLKIVAQLSLSKANHFFLQSVLYISLQNATVPSEAKENLNKSDQMYLKIHFPLPLNAYFPLNTATK